MIIELIRQIDYLTMTALTTNSTPKHAPNRLRCDVGASNVEAFRNFPSQCSRVVKHFVDNHTRRQLSLQILGLCVARVHVICLKSQKSFSETAVADKVFWEMPTFQCLQCLTR